MSSFLGLNKTIVFFFIIKTVYLLLHPPPTPYMCVRVRVCVCVCFTCTDKETCVSMVQLYWSVFMIFLLLLIPC
jgi:hypothetical protein